MADRPHPLHERLLRGLLVQPDVAFILLDLEGRVISWLRGAEAILGYTSEEALGRPIDFIFTDEDRRLGIPQFERAVALSEGTADDDRWQVRKDGSRVWVFGVMFAVREESGQLVGFAKMLRNRTDIRQRLEELHHRVEELARTNDRKDVFLGTLAHELRSPLAPLVNAVELIRLTEPKPPTLEYPVRLIERQVAALRRLVDDLLDLTRVGTGKVELRLETIDLSVIITHSVDTVRPCFDQRQHRLAVLHPTAPITVHVDPVRLQQVFVNLLENACKYTEPGGRIWIESTVEGDEAVVNVTDTGIGIPPDMQGRIFDLFTQVETPPYGSRGGLGIGLALVRDLVALHGGSVQVMSHGADKGSRFSVRLPLAAYDTGEATLRRA
jgi:two-component system CheB/CheR fusion protein